MVQTDPVKIKFATALLVIGLLLQACSIPMHKASVEVKQITMQHASTGQQYWWYVQFIKQWPKETKAPFYLDTLLAQQVIAPVLYKHRQRIRLWRFHRRAVRDNAGAKFAFIFYASSEDARIMIDEIKNNSLLQEMISTGVVERFFHDDVEKPIRPGVGDVGDPAWSQEVKDSWPYYIMGISQTWLGFIEASSRDDLQQNGESLDEMMELYKQVSDKVDAIWLKNGHHAFLHHLSAVFGYRPIEMRY